MTNADKIRSMTDDELLGLLHRSCGECLGRYTCDMDRDRCNNDTMQWLHKEWDGQTEVRREYGDSAGLTDKIRIFKEWK